MSKLTRFCLAGLILGLSQYAFAASYQVIFQNASDLGTSYAGGAAAAEDASTGFFNPAGLVFLPAKSQLAASAILINGDITYRGTSLIAPQGGTAVNDISTVIPAFHYSQKLSDRWAFGFGVTAPYGLSEVYPNHSIINYLVTHSALVAMNFSPSLAYKINHKLAVGFGLDVQRAQQINEQIVTIPEYYRSGLLKNDLTGTGYGWHGGIMYQVTPKLRLGVNYRFQVVHHLSGPSTFISPFPATTAESQITLPPMSTVSFHYDVNKLWALMGTVDYTEWSVHRNSFLKNMAIAPGQSVNVPTNYQNTWRYALGASYKITDRLTLKVGASYDQSPINEVYREVILPDADSIGIATGAHFQITRMVGLDLGYSHSFIKEGKINRPGPTEGTVGASKIKADVLGLQVTWSFA